MRNSEITLSCAVAIAFLAGGLVFEFKEQALARPDATVSLTDLVPPGKALPPAQQTRLRVAIGPQMPGHLTPGGFQAASSYLSRRLGQPVDVVRGRSLGGVIADVRAGDVSVGIMASGPFVLARREFGLIPLAAPIVRGRSTHRSCLVVRRGSKVRKIADLRGRSFAFTDPLSIAGGLVPTASLARFGEKPATFFSRVVYTHDHRRSIAAVAEGVVDGAAVDSLAYDAAARDAILKPKIRAVWRSIAFANGPVAVHPRTPVETRSRLLAVLLEMHREPAGRKVLASLGVDGFERVVNDPYKTVEALLHLGGAM